MFPISIWIRRRCRALTYAVLLLFPVTTEATVRIIQTNAAGDNIHLIDPATNKVVGIISGIEVNHGAAMSPDGSRFYFTNEADHTVDIVDGKSYKVIKKIPLTGRPNNLIITADGKRIYVAIRAESGGVDVIDTAAGERVKNIPTGGPVHNPYLTPDGKFIIGGSIEAKRFTVMDAVKEEPLWVLEFDRGVRPMAFEKNPDGSTSRMFVQLSDFHGFAIVDFAQRKEVGRIEMPQVPFAERHMDMLQGSPAHGFVITPDGKTLWVNSKMNSKVYVYSLPDLKLAGEVAVGNHPDWLTVTPDGKSIYVANAGSNSVSAIDVASKREIARIPVGQVPKRNIAVSWP